MYLHRWYASRQTQLSVLTTNSASARADVSIHRLFNLWSFQRKRWIQCQVSTLTDYLCWIQLHSVILWHLLCGTWTMTKCPFECFLTHHLSSIPYNISREVNNTTDTYSCILVAVDLVPWQRGCCHCCDSGDLGMRTCHDVENHSGGQAAFMPGNKVNRVIFQCNLNVCKTIGNNSSESQPPWCQIGRPAPISNFELLFFVYHFPPTAPIGWEKHTSTVGAIMLTPSS